METAFSAGAGGWYDYFTSPHEIDEMRKNMIAVAVGGDHICGITAKGIVKCLGENSKGQLGDGTTKAVYYAKDVKRLETSELLPRTYITPVR